MDAFDEHSQLFKVPDVTDEVSRQSSLGLINVDAMHGRYNVCCLISCSIIVLTAKSIGYV